MKEIRLHWRWNTKSNCFYSSSIIALGGGCWSRDAGSFHDGFMDVNDSTADFVATRGACDHYKGK